ncbi:MAG TPA: hypothetical protein VK810_02645 [Dongiaceae bacterium]|jgi:hypothetical protein|nr:hypothetical protein [Dongiaceae bacterium]
MKTIKFIILFCLAVSTAVLIFALHAENDFLGSGKTDLLVSSTSSKAKNIRQEFISADENGKTKIFDDFVTHIQDRDKAIAKLIDGSYNLTQSLVLIVFITNFFAAFCVIYSLVKTKAAQKIK